MLGWIWGIAKVVGGVLFLALVALAAVDKILQLKKNKVQAFACAAPFAIIALSPSDGLRIFHCPCATPQVWNAKGKTVVITGASSGIGKVHPVLTHAAPLVDCLCLS
jgi:hypothetical protein